MPLTSPVLRILVLLLGTVALALAGLAVDASSAPAAPKKPVIKRAACWPPEKCTEALTVPPRGRLRLAGRGLRAGMAVSFRRRGGKGKRKFVTAKLRRKGRGWEATVPGSARSGKIFVSARGGRRSNLFGPVNVVKPARPSPAPTERSSGASAVFDGNGMWIWYVNQSNGGDPSAIIAQARAHDVKTVFVKSGDGGSSYWSQFSPELVSALKGGGLNVCAWQFVYGDRPSGEAALGARAVQAGADCLIIDAEGQYEGKYASASTYIRELRQQIGGSYPVGIAPFPYVDYHASFPYSVFLAPGAAEANLPQMYWKAIGTSVEENFAHTYTWNRIYKRPIYPLGQTYQNPPAGEIVRFRQVAQAYGATGVSWWVWSETSAGEWNAIGQGLQPLSGFAPATSYPPLARGAKGDPVVWAQQHLVAAGHPIPVNGQFDTATQNAVGAFQGASSLPVTGRLDDGTWAALLKFDPAPIDWSNKPAPRYAATARGRVQSGPSSASIPAVRNEIAAKPDGHP